MGEIEDTTKDSPRSLGKAPEGSEETTPIADAKTYTEKDVEKAVQVALTKAGRDAKALETQAGQIKADQEAIEATRAELDEIQRQIDQSELEAARGDSAKLRELQAKKSYKAKLAELDTKNKELQKREAELDRREAEHASKIQAAEETQLEIEIWKIAKAEGVDPVELKDMMKDLKLTTVEQAKGLAKRLNKKPEDENTKKKSTHDSLVTSGGTKSQEGKSARQIYADNFRSEKK